ncbi:hypothetical protein CERSUDRAFT_91943 [Gelatoporia subvermispora B]|uniref:BTB domain-containing protein n=1 Tax=Ceriporiopsis subvermispora (strain B) TaxID=914234 RepID=M2RQL7_CERS8|nr:hypothetical protein CERSUDRAFT_91943 [Gelatoporia subvermispora B]
MDTTKASTPLFENIDNLLWFDDGNVILIAEGVAFRVYQGLLSTRSTVFRDLFQVPQPPDGESYEGCPVIRLHDKRMDLHALLRTLFGFKEFLDVEKITFCDISPLVRLSHKYDIKDLYESTSKRLKTMFPTQLHDFDNMRTVYSQSEAIEAVNLARLIDEESILPVSFYLCCQRSLQNWWENDADQNDFLQLVDARDREKCRELQTWLRVTNYRLSIKMLCGSTYHVCWNRKNKSPCARVLQEKTAAFVSERGLEQDLTDCALFHSKEHLWTSPVLCEFCTKELSRRHRTERLRLWNRLPSILGIKVPNWPCDAEVEDGTSW